MKSALAQRDDGSCVIVTTRSEQVARSMGANMTQILHLQLLSEEDSWLLFYKIAFANEGGQCVNVEIEQIGKEIVAQCHNLPLTIKVVGGMMREKELSYSEWKKAFAHLKEELAAHNKDKLVLSTLQLSYENLPVHLKPCMLCFAAFPEDFEIDFVDVIFWWIGEGFVRGRDGKTALEIGEENWTELINRGLLLGSRMDDFEKQFSKCRVHDMVRDMIVQIAKEENFMGLDEKSNPLLSIQPSLNIQSRRLCVMKTTTNGLFFSKDVSKLLQLRTLICENSRGSEFIPILYKLKWLRVLVIKINETYEEKGEWWSGIGSFPHLIYLRIENSRLERLPDSIQNLRNLQVLLLWGCRNLKTLPIQITSLEKLTVFRVWDSPALECYPVQIGKLSNLQILGWPFCSKVEEGCRMSELQNLTQLRDLNIEIDLKDGIREEELHVMSQLKQLKIPRIEFMRSNSSDEELEQLLGKVDYDLSSPCHQLEELHICFFPGERTPAWLNPTTLPNLRFLLHFRWKHEKHASRVLWK